MDGIKFDSKKEAEYYQKLKILLKQGVIKDLELQKEYLLQDKFVINGKTIRAIKYRADFVYYDTRDKQEHIVDIKGSKRTMTTDFKIKKKLFAYKYGKEIEVVI